MCVLLFVVGHRLINHKCISKYDSIEDRSRWQLITFWFRSFTPLHSDWLWISYNFKLSYQYTITIHFFTTRQLKIAILVLNLKLNQSPPTPKTKRKRKKIMYWWSIFPHLPIWKTYICLDETAHMFDIDQIQILAPMSQIMSSHTNIVMHSEKGLYMFFFYKQSSFYFLIIIVILIGLLIYWTDSIWQAKKLCILRTTYSRQIFKIDCIAWSRMKIIRRGFHHYIKKKKKNGRCTMNGQVQHMYRHLKAD